MVTVIVQCRYYLFFRYKLRWLWSKWDLTVPRDRSDGEADTQIKPCIPTPTYGSAKFMGINVYGVHFRFNSIEADEIYRHYP